MTGAWWEYVAVFAVSLFIAWVLTPLLVRLALRRGVLDRPGGHKSHTSPIPYLGGLAMVGGLSLAVILAAVVRPPRLGLDELAIILGMALGLAIIGLVDDLRHVPPVVRLAVQAAAGAGVWVLDAGANFTGVDALNCAVTILWVVGITNAFNLLDNMDGLSAGVAAIAACSFGVIAAINGQYLIGGLSFGLVGCALGFLPHNFEPARIYMGDTGSLYLGFVLSYLGLKLRFDAPDDVTFLVPIVVLAIPIIDTALVAVTRILRHESPFVGGRDHLSHRLVRLGIPIRMAVGSIYVAAASLGVVGLVISRIDRTSAYLLAALVFALGVLGAVLLGRVPLVDDGTRVSPLVVRHPDEDAVASLAARRRASG